MAIVVRKLSAHVHGLWLRQSAPPPRHAAALPCSTTGNNCPDSPAVLMLPLLASARVRTRLSLARAWKR